MLALPCDYCSSACALCACAAGAMTDTPVGWGGGALTIPRENSMACRFALKNVCRPGHSNAAPASIVYVPPGRGRGLLVCLSSLS